MNSSRHHLLCVHSRGREFKSGVTKVARIVSSSVRVVDRIERFRSLLEIVRLDQIVVVPVTARVAIGVGVCRRVLVRAGKRKALVRIAQHVFMSSVGGASSSSFH